MKTDLLFPLDDPQGRDDDLRVFPDRIQGSSQSEFDLLLQGNGQFHHWLEVIPEIEFAAYAKILQLPSFSGQIIE